MAFDPLNHPDHLTIQSPVGHVYLSAWDQPDLAKVIDGDPTLGWEGDPRLCWYWDGQEQRGVLARREDDGEYRITLVLQPYQMGLTAAANRIINRLIEADVQRGADPKRLVDKHNAMIDKQREDRAREERGPVIEKLAWGVGKDLGVGPRSTSFAMKEKAPSI